MYQEESIYNLVPKDKIAPIKEPRYKSQFPHWIAPTASTFCLKTSSFPDVANINGEITNPRGAHPLKGSWATFGKPDGLNKKDPNNFTKKGHQYRTLPEPERLRATTEIKKPSVPTIKDKPIMGLKSDKNYITANAVDIILMAPKKRETEKLNYLNKKTFGQIPGYLSKLKGEIENEYKTIREMQLRTDDEEAKKKKLLNEDEVCSLREGLKKKLEQLKISYGELTHKKYFDTLVSKRKYIIKILTLILGKNHWKKKWKLLKKIY